MNERQPDRPNGSLADARPGPGFALAGCAVIAWVLVATAWMSDDAYITLRTIDNFVHGYGLRWNIGERVQAFTHPAWLLLLTPFYAVTREAFYTTLAVQIALTLTTGYVLIRFVAMTVGQALFSLALFVSSKALVDFSTSGLENPLTHLLLVAIFLVWRSHATSPRVQTLAALVACAMLCRVEIALLVAPAIIYLVLQAPKARVRDLAIGFLPFVAWEFFSVVYYGALVPNTALAKLATGIPAADLMRQGWHYWSGTFAFDPMTPVMLVITTLLVAAGYGSKGVMMALGVVLYAAFVVRAGGDFMSGRFFTPMLVWALVGVAGLEPGGLVAARWVFPAAAAAVLAAGLLTTSSPPLLSGPRFGTGPVSPAAFEHFGVTDERRFYYPTLGLLRRLGFGGRYQPNTSVAYGETMRRLPPPQVKEASNVGLFGYAAGPTVHIIDRNALGDPLLARLPATTPWRVGHFTRAVPGGYVDTWQTGTNVLVDLRLRQFYDRIREVTQGPVWTFPRFRTVARLALGQLQP